MHSRDLGLGFKNEYIMIKNSLPSDTAPALLKHIKIYIITYQQMLGAIIRNMTVHICWPVH
jgi:hypothetical protein